MPFSTSTWESPEGNLDASDFCAVCLIDTNPAGREKIKANCKLPIRSRPGGPVNVNAVRAAAAALMGARGGLKDVPAAERKGAARRLVRLMREADVQPGEGIVRLAGLD